MRWGLLPFLSLFLASFLIEQNQKETESGKKCPPPPLLFPQACAQGRPPNGDPAEAVRGKRGQQGATRAPQPLFPRIQSRIEGGKDFDPPQGGSRSFPIYIRNEGVAPPWGLKKVFCFSKNEVFDMPPGNEV